MDGKQLIKQALAETCRKINNSNYDVENEMEFCNLFFYALALCAENVHVPLNKLRSEIILADRGRIDIGIRSLVENGAYEVFIEAKVWIRPLNVSHMSKANVATRKRNECIKDASRLSRLMKNNACLNSALLVLERNSTHLRRLLGPEFEKGVKSVFDCIRRKV